MKNAARNGPRKDPGAKLHGIWPHEIEPGRSVVADWDAELRETWAERKARRQRERDQAA